MQIFHGRPLALAICISVFISVLSVQFSATVKLILLSVFLFFTVILLLRFLCRRQCGRGMSILILTLLLSCSMLLGSWLFFDRSVERFEERAANGCTVEGYVCDRLSSSPFESRFAVVLDEINGERERTKVWLELAYPSSLQIGERFRLYGTLSAAEDLPSYPEKKLLLADGCVGILRCESAADCTVLAERQSGLLLRMKQWNFSLSERLRHAVGGEEGDLCAAFLLGDRSGLSGDTTLAFRRSGISHLLALSGMHVSALILILEFLLKNLRISKRLRAILVPVSAIFYLLLTGGALSTVRAVLMLCAVYLAFLLAEDGDPFTALCVALAVSVIAAPNAILDVSLWLSFSAAAGIVVFLPVIRAYFGEAEWIKRMPKLGAKLIKGVVLALAVGVFANAAVLAFLAYFFGSASLFSVPITMLLSPILLPALLLSAIALLLPSFAPITVLARVCMNGILWVSHQISEIPYGTVRLDGTVTVLLLAALVLSLIVIAVVRIERMRWLAVPVLLSAAVILAGYLDVLPSRSGTAVTYVTTDAGDALVLTNGRKTVAVDLSDGASEVYTEILRTSASDRFTELQEVVFTHYYAKMPRVLSALAEDIKLRAIRLPTPITEEERAIAARVSQEAALHGIRVLTEQDAFSLPNASIGTLLRADPNSAHTEALVTVRVFEKNVLYLDASFLKDPSAEVLQAYLSADQVFLSSRSEEFDFTEAFPLRNEIATTWIFSTDALRESFFQRYSMETEKILVGSVRFFLK